MNLDPLALISRYYDPESELYAVLVDHSRQVAQKSLEIANDMARRDPAFKPDLEFIENAAMLHDIGIFKTRAPAIGCHGDLPYICHGYLGRDLLDSQGLPKPFGLVAERHTGAGITLDNIVEAKLPLPPRDMLPTTLEEKIICCADKFFSKTPKNKNKTMTRDSIITQLHKINPGHAQRFSVWAGEFGL